METLWSYHVVQPGDNTRSWPRPIRCPKTPCVLPNLTDNQLAAGDLIRIPIHFYLGDLEPVIHRVEIGDTLKIAHEYNVMAQLLEWTKLSRWT